jgi:hypothetical protein
MLTYGAETWTWTTADISTLTKAEISFLIIIKKRGRGREQGKN